MGILESSDSQDSQNFAFLFLNENQSPEYILSLKISVKHLQTTVNASILKRPAACSCSEEALCGCIFTGKDLSRKNGDSMFFLSYKVGKIKHWI